MVIVLVTFYALLLGIFLFFLKKRFSWKRSLAITVSRILWTIPIISTWFPKEIHLWKPKVLQLKPLSILIDNSKSMQDHHGNLMLEFPKYMQNLCQNLACQPKITKLSDLSPLVRQGYTPLLKTMNPWLQTTSGGPWIVLTDGSDYQPQRIKEQLVAFSQEGFGNGAILGLLGKTTLNYWLTHIESPSFAFAHTPIKITVTLNRDHFYDHREEIPQLQVFLADKILISQDISFFDEKDSSRTVDLYLPPLPKGRHLFQVRVIGSASEKVLFDNTQDISVDIQRNTIGVLHLLGSPSWDGRFLRRYLKAEPKYDLISFFILRDPWDRYQLDERELSLIPFPVDRLFTEELANFQVIILQNFMLSRFLQKKHQKNLVKFVQSGGGLLFIGGPRALQAEDVKHSPLKKILPFTTLEESTGRRARQEPYSFSRLFVTDKSSYDEKIAYRIQLASLSGKQQAFATIYDHWHTLAPELRSFRYAKGLHKIQPISSQNKNFIPLLEAKTEDGKTFPLVLASYPEKGRVIWALSDSFWKLGLESKFPASQFQYQRLIDGAMSWLLGSELRNPLVLEGFKLIRRKDGGTSWSVFVTGSAAKYLENPEYWRLSVCDQVISLSEVLLKKIHDQQWELKQDNMKFLPKELRCTLSLEGKNKIFGHMKSRLTKTIAEEFMDDELYPQKAVLQALAKHLKAKLFIDISSTSYSKNALEGWLGNIINREALSVPQIESHLQDHYWLFKHWSYVLFVFFLLVEILLRRWQYLFSKHW